MDADDWASSINTDQALNAPIGSGEMVSKAISLLVDEMGELKDLSLSTINFAEEAIATNHPDSSILKGLLSRGPGSNVMECYHEAVNRGSTHPLLYYLLGKCTTRLPSPKKDQAAEYYCKAIGAGCTLGIIGIHGIEDSRAFSLLLDRIVEPGRPKSLFYLEEKEREGVVDGYIFNAIAHDLTRLEKNAPIREGTTRRALTAGKKADYLKGGRRLKALPVVPKDMVYHQRAAKLGFVDSVIALHRYWLGTHVGEKRHPDRAFRILLEAIDRGIIDERLVTQLLDSIPQVSQEVIGHLTPMEVYLGYCDRFIQEKSAVAYLRKALVYYNGVDEIPVDKEKAVGILLEADKVGVATHNIYKELIEDYTDGTVVPKDGAKILEYCEKAIKTASDRTNLDFVYLRMGYVYEEGIPPIEKDPIKAAEYKEKGKGGGVDPSVAELYSSIGNLFAHMGEIDGQVEGQDGGHEGGQEGGQAQGPPPDCVAV